MSEALPLKDIFSIVVDERIDAPDAYVVSDFRLVPKVLMTVFEGRAIHKVLLSEWPEGMSPQHPLATLRDVYGNNEVIIACKPVTDFLFEGQLIKETG